MSFGGAVKLTGENEYRNALKSITTSLKEVGSQLTLTATKFDSNDKSIGNLTKKQNELSKTYETQKKLVESLQKSYTSFSQKVKDQEKAHEELNKEYTDEKAKLDALGKTVGTTSKEYQDQKAKVDDLEKSVIKSRQANEQNQQSLSRMGSALNKAETDLVRTEKALGQVNDELNQSEKEAKEASTAYNTLKTTIADQESKLEELRKEYANTVLEQGKNSKAAKELKGDYAQLAAELSNNKTKMDGVENELNQLGDSARKSGEAAEKAKEGFTVFKGVLSNLASQAISAAISGLKKLGGAVINVGKQAVASYAEYEQLAGGVETLFKDSAGTVKEYAANAYKTAQISANEYMETVTSFSASLLQGLNGDTAKAAKIADMAIIDMSDNANKMGTSMEMIQNAYQGFAKDNFTMLDNLKLGYGGTQAEAARLVNETGVMGKAFKATAKNVKDVPFDKFIEAIHKVQVQMGITGTSALEASGTIEGSTKSMKAAWSNLLTAIADDNADLSKSIDIFVKNAVGAAKNTVPKIKNVVDSIKKMGNSIVKEVFPQIKREIPQLKPLIDTFEWFVKNKNLVVGALKAMVAAFAVSKILSFTKGLSEVSKTLIEVIKSTLASTTALGANTAAQAANTTAQVAGATATTGLTTATKLLNAAWAANPVGVVVAGLTALVAIIATVVKKTNELTEEEKAQQKALEEQHEEIQRNAEAWDDLVEAQQNSINSGMSEITHLGSLYDELQTLVDANGKVKKGYEERASFITSRLSEALGIEIKDIDGVIQNYGKLKKSIDEVMEKKKAQIILDSQESLYKEAIEKQDGALRNLISTNDAYKQKKQELSDLEAELTRLQGVNDNFATAIMVANAQKKVDAKKKEVEELGNDYNKQKDLYSEYAYNIGLYEQNLAAFHAEKYDEMSTTTWEYVKDYQGAEEAEKKIIEDKLTVTNLKLKELETLRKKSNSKIYDEQIKAAKKEKTQLESQLKQYEQTTDSGLKKTEIVWSNSLAEQLSNITGSKIEFKNAGNGLVQAVVDGEKVGAPKSKTEMAKLATDAIKEVASESKKKGAKKAGEDLIDGVNNGIKNQNKQSGVFKSIASFGSKLLSKLKASLKEKSPSRATKEMGGFLLEGLSLGVDDEESETLKRVANAGRKVISTLNTELSKGANLKSIGISANTRKSITSLNRKTNNSLQGQKLKDEYNSMLAAFKQALKEMKIELDDEVAAKFVERTVARAIY